MAFKGRLSVSGELVWEFLIRLVATRDSPSSVALRLLSVEQVQSATRLDMI